VGELQESLLIYTPSKDNLQRSIVNGISFISIIYRINK